MGDGPVPEPGDGEFLVRTMAIIQDTRCSVLAM